MGEMFIRPGMPDDDNRDYLPEKLKGTDIVVNENGNNSQPYPKNLKEFHGVIADGVEDEWYVYLPDSYNPTKKAPLVISMHGGMMTGWGQAIYTSWTLAADRDGFLVVFPNASYNRFWQVQWGTWEINPEKISKELMEGEPEGVVSCPPNIADNHDIKLVTGLIQRMKNTYNIDEGRIFMQGMSMGNMMTGLFARNFGNLLAGAAGSGAAAFLSLVFDKQEKIINKGGPLAIWQSRPELNAIPDERELEKKVHKYNRLYWMRINECELLPQISIRGENNLAFYKGKNADFVYYDIKNRDHGQTLDDAALIWDYLFSGIRRQEDGTIVCTKPVKERRGDEFAFAVTAGSSKVWLKNQIYEMTGKALKWKKMKYHGLEGGQKIRGEYFMLPLSFLVKAYDAKLEYLQENLAARITMADGRTLQFARGSIGCVIDQSLVQMYCEALQRGAELYISAEWFSEYVCNMYISTCEEVLYVTNHVNKLSANMADLIKDILMDTIVPENKIKLLPGTPDDNNTEYLPESIKGSDIVVNENGNNSQPYPKNLVEFHEIMGNDTPDTWYEYVPEGYVSSRKTALVFAMHGGLMTGWGQAVYTSWTMVADRDNIIVVFPNAHSRRLWTLEATDFEREVDKQMPVEIRQNYALNEENPDIKLVHALMQYLKEKYNIDEERIFMQGMSNGNMFTSHFARYYGRELTAVSGAGGGTPNPRLLYRNGKIKNEAGPVGMWMSIPETNGCPPWCEFDDLAIYKYTRVYWNELNGCHSNPEISIIGENAFAFYKGANVDNVFFEIKNRDHGQTLDEAAIVWDYYFSGLRRKKDGSIVDEGSRIPRVGDKFAVSVADGCRTAWFNNRKVEMKTAAVKWQKLKYHGLNGDKKVKGEYICAPVSFIAEVFNAKYQYDEEAAIAYMHLNDGRSLQFARGSIAYVINNDIRCMYCEALHRNGELCISLEWFARIIMNICASKCGDVLYVTDHYAELGVDMADLIHSILKNQKEEIPNFEPAVQRSQEKERNGD